ncbi:MAG: DUF4381 family protein [Desulfobacteraceae bacterium]|jgi:hypothetical protein|nr:DUF4381 family protein [Desulfobacteraceae bacterium]
MMIAFKIPIWDCIIGRRCISNAASSLWPCRKHDLQRYLTGMVFFLLMFLQVPQLMGEETAAPAGPLTATESSPSNVPAPMTDIHDIQPPVSVGIDAPWLIPVLLGLAAAAILAAGWWSWNKHKKNRTIETIVPELPPEMTAMQALDQIADVQKLDGKAFYFRLSAILRQYVFGRFAVGAPEMTTEEFIPCIDRLNMDKRLARRLKGLCRNMDPVKFGSERAVEKQMETDLMFAREFVRKTTLADEEENKGEQHMMLPLDDGKAKKQIPTVK